MIRFSPETQSTRDCLKWWWWRALLGFLILWASVLIIFPLTQVISAHFDAETWWLIPAYMYDVFAYDLLRPFKDYGNWFYEYAFNEPRHYNWYSYFSWRSMLIPTGLFIFYQIWICYINPNGLLPQRFGTGREANPKDVQEMGLYDGKHLLLGIFGGKKMRLPDTRSVFCIGCPGSGKTTGVIIPSILDDTQSTLIIHDPKGEIAKLTSGYRATLGPVFKMNWMGKDTPEKGIRWPSWNPIGGGNLPSLGGGREGYIDNLISFLIPDGPSGTDPYWVKTGRGCLTGLTGYLCGKVEQAQANDYFLSRIKDNALDEEDYEVLISFYESMRDFPEVLKAKEHAQNRNINKDTYLPVGTWDLIPESWHGHDACFAMLLDIINTAQIRCNAEIAERQKAQDISALNLDAWQMIFEQVVLETAYYGYGRRTLLELNQVLSLPDKQRGSVMSMALSGVNIFKNSAVRCRTSMNDFNYDQLRGIVNPETGKCEPVTLYMSVPYEDLKSSVLLSTLFINMATAYLMEFGPNQGSAGPCSVGFILDEFQHMPSLDIITDGIIFGRTKQNKFLVCVQDWHQINSKYKQETTDIILSSSAVKIIKRQNNPITRNPLTKGIETLTKVVKSRSSSWSWFDVSGPLVPTKAKVGFNMYFPVKVTRKVQSDTVIGGSGILSMAMDKQLVLYAGHLTRPINKVTTPLYFKNAEFKEKAAIKPAPAIPDYIIREADEMARIGQMHVTTIIN